MTKIMLVEDDKSLREIYGVRLLAEGYDIVSAGDGEEALAMAIKERPVLIITDVMMPRISGFDMLDILRSTTETKSIKVIMMTALSSEDQRKHGEQLGADRYLVKSQVGIEDVVRVVHEVLGDAAPASAPAPAAPNPAMPSQAQAPTTVTPIPRPVATTPPRTMPADPMVKPPAIPVVPPAQAQAGMPALHTTLPAAPSTRQKVIQPINDPTARVDINNLLDKELAREAGVDMNKIAQTPTTAQEKAVVANQLASTLPQTAMPPKPAMPSPAPAPAAPLAPPAAPVIPPRPPVQAPPRPNIAPMQPRPDSTTTPPTV